MIMIGLGDAIAIFFHHVSKWQLQTRDNYIFLAVVNGTRTDVVAFCQTCCTHGLRIS
jgi:hypothetical protein